jgi:siroheme synthase-like protein
MFPVFLDLTDRLAVVVGGGPVGLRKTAALRAAGARVRVVCLEPRPADRQDDDLQWLTVPYAPEHLDGAALVFAAANPAVNRRVVADARARDVWVSDAGDPAAGDFITPALLRRGELVVAVATGGAAPLLAARLRDALEETIDPLYGEWVQLLAELRPIVQDRLPPQNRPAVWERLCAEDWLLRLRTNGIDSVRTAMRRVIEDEERGIVG